MSEREQRPIRWALICTPETMFPVPVIRLVMEERVKAWEDYGWVVMVRDTDVIFADLDEVRREDESGRR